jgi:hypothetical protein
MKKPDFLSGVREIPFEEFLCMMEGKTISSILQSATIKDEADLYNNLHVETGDLKQTFLSLINRRRIIFAFETNESLFGKINSYIYEKNDSSSTRTLKQDDLHLVKSMDLMKWTLRVSGFTRYKSRIIFLWKTFGEGFFITPVSDKGCMARTHLIN